MTTRVYLALGSNVGDREDYLRQAVKALESPGLHITRVSPIYETAPQGYLDQGWFLNLVLEGNTSIPPLSLLARLQEIERMLKRLRDIPNGPRTLDIDLLFYGDQAIHSAELEVPHPRFRQRRFVLQPLADLCPDLRDPVTQRRVWELLKDLGETVTDQPVRRTDIVISAMPSF